MTRKSEHLQIRVTPAQKAALQRRAATAGRDLSSFVLSRALPDEAERLQELVDRLATGDRRFALAAVNDLLAATPAVLFDALVRDLSVDALEPWLRNYVTAMIEHAAALKQVPPPAWARRVQPLDRPHFAAPLPGLRLHLLRHAPAAFKRRNLFVDSTVGDRV